MNNLLVQNEINKLVQQKWTPGSIALSGTLSSESFYFDGYTNDDKTCLVDTNTLIDLASVTKIFTLFLTMYLYDNDMIDLDNPISYYTSRFENIGDIKIYELMNFSKILVTSKRLDNIDDQTKIFDVIHEAKVQENKVKYSDIGSIVLSTMLDDTYGKDFFRNKMRELWKKTDMKRTFWWDELTSDDNIFNYDNEYRYINNELITISTPIGIVHDQKARNIGACGHSGIFSCASDICKFSKALLTESIISSDTINVLTSQKYDSFDSDGRHFGLLCFKKTDNKYNEIPSNSSDNSISISGYTGTYYAIDFEKKRFYFIGSDRIHNNLTTKEAIHVDIQPYKRNSQSYAYIKDTLRDLLY